jgi:hypothetical protein
MSRIRLMMLSLLAVFAMSAVASASASANEKCPPHEGPKPTEEVELCIKGEEAGSPNEHLPVPFVSVKTATTTSKLEVTGGPKLECKKASNKGQFDKENGNIIDNDHSVEVSDLYITFTECKVTNNSKTEEKCAVHSPNSADGTIVVSGGTTGKIPPELNPDDGLDGRFLTGNPAEITLEPSNSTEPFVVIVIGNKAGTCPFTAGSFNVTGKQKCKVVTPETQAVIHKLKCATTESELTFGTSSVAVFEITEDVELQSTELWGLIKS